MSYLQGDLESLDYIQGLYSSANPLRMPLRMLDLGYLPQKIENACDLGFGFGINAAIQNAASPVNWYGTDYNAGHAAFANELVSASGKNAGLYDQTFEEFCGRTDLPDFDFVSLHGIWSWVSDDNRAVIVDFLRRKVRPGGVVYISYNCLPGWAPMVPWRNLMIEHAHKTGTQQEGVSANVKKALEFVEGLWKTEPWSAASMPRIGLNLQQIREQDMDYVVHEYFASDWNLKHIWEVAAEVAPAKLQYAYEDDLDFVIDAFNITPKQMEFLAQVTDPVFREGVRDFMIGRRFRKDFWLKGGRKIGLIERLAAIRAAKVVLTQHRDRVKLKVDATLGEVDLMPSVYNPVLDAIADNRPHTIAEIESKLAPLDIDLMKIMAALMTLISKNSVFHAQDEDAIARARPHTDALNRTIMDRAWNSNKFKFLASPVTGGGLVIERFDMLFAVAHQNGQRTADEIANFVLNRFKTLGVNFEADNFSDHYPADEVETIRAKAVEFVDQRVQVMKALQLF